MHAAAAVAAMVEVHSIILLLAITSRIIQTKQIKNRAELGYLNLLRASDLCCGTFACQSL